MYKLHARHRSPTGEKSVKMCSLFIRMEETLVYQFGPTAQVLVPARRVEMSSLEIVLWVQTPRTSPRPRSGVFPSADQKPTAIAAGCIRCSRRVVESALRRSLPCEVLLRQLRRSALGKTPLLGQGPAA